MSTKAQLVVATVPFNLSIRNNTNV
jgi:hypothetical protein